MAQAEKATATAGRKLKQTEPEKLFFKIGEVSAMTEMEPYVLRYWERRALSSNLGLSQAMYRHQSGANSVDKVAQTQVFIGRVLVVVVVG